MKKLSLSLIAAGVMAVAGFAQADVIFYPDGTSVELGESGADQLALSSSDSLSSESIAMSDTSDTSVLGAGPSTTTTVSTTQYVYVQPNIDFDRNIARKQMARNSHLMSRGNVHEGTSATATFNSPTRAGEASTMTNGVPNMLTSNDRMVVGSYSIPLHSVTVTEPYYVFSY